MTEKTTQSEQTGQSLIDRDCVFLDGTCFCKNLFKECKYRVIKTVYEDGFSWVEIPDDLWDQKETHTYINGMEID
jgi:hypothetical protein